MPAKITPLLAAVGTLVLICGFVGVLLLSGVALALLTLGVRPLRRSEHD